ncbi:maltooligosyl trehalose synthase [Arthrobacter sp. Hiyo8]|nr:maltooligosyl trehalose synthase [Arthrobacter sp. Hiyo8]
MVDALAEIIASFHVYRSYLPYGKDTLVEAVERAARTRPELEPVIKALLPLLLEASHELGRRFQQTSGMVMAKGVEDTAFFRYTRLGTLTEVGADPTEFALTAPGFHERMVRRQALLPLSMTTLTTHDTKRSEDTRARISAISEAVPEWEAFVDRMQELARFPTGHSQPSYGKPSQVRGRPAVNASRVTSSRLPAKPATPPAGPSRTKRSKRRSPPPSTPPSICPS